MCGIAGIMRRKDSLPAPRLLDLFDRSLTHRGPDGRGDYEHNAALLVFDARGRMVRVFDVAVQQLALDYARHLARSAP